MMEDVDHVHHTVCIVLMQINVSFVIINLYYSMEYVYIDVYKVIPIFHHKFLLIWIIESLIIVNYVSILAKIVNK